MGSDTRRIRLLIGTGLLALAFAVGISAAGRAAVLFTADLTHAQETVTGNLTFSNGDPRPLSFGTATLSLNDAQTELTLMVTIFNIDVTGTQTLDTFDNLVAAHIHSGATPGSNAPVAWGFFGVPDNDSNPDNLVVTPFASGVGGTFTSIWNQPEGNGGRTLTSELPNLLANLTYINFHTVQFPGGEIRGQILRVPEPGTLALFGVGLGYALWQRRRAKRIAA